MNQSSHDCACSQNCGSNCNCALPGVCCEVEACVHNDGHSNCTARQITVKNRMAVLGEETRCETFEEA